MKKILVFLILTSCITINMVRYGEQTETEPTQGYEFTPDQEEMILIPNFELYDTLNWLEKDTTYFDSIF